MYSMVWGETHFLANPVLSCHVMKIIPVIIVTAGYPTSYFNFSSSDIFYFAFSLIYVHMVKNLHSNCKIINYLGHLIEFGGFSEEWTYIAYHCTFDCSGQRALAGPIFIFPIWLPGIYLGPPHMVHGVGYFGILVKVRNKLWFPNFLYIGFPLTTPSCNFYTA